MFISAARAVNPPPDGDYGNANTAEGQQALANVTPNSDTLDGVGNTALGNYALYANTTGGFNTATGDVALQYNISGNFNTATGYEALQYNTSGYSNTATGAGALQNNTTGSYNTAIGIDALFYNSAGADNTASGIEALANNTTGHYNTATGSNALASNTSGTENTAVGYKALYNYDGDASTATGFQALMNNSTGFGNNADGWQALTSNTSGGTNTASGFAALQSNTTGSSNTATGYDALLQNVTGSNNTAFGHFTLINATGSSNIAMGDLAGENLTNGSNNIDVGNKGKAGESGTIRLGTQGTQSATFIAGISGVAVTGRQVLITSAGKLGVAASSARFKEQIRPMDKASESILKLKPVTFRYKENIDPDKIPQFGLIAEEVGKIDPDLVVRDEDGKVSSVRYEAVNAMLLNEFLKEHHKAEEQQAVVSELKSIVTRQEKRIETLSTSLQQVSDQLQTRQHTLVAGN